MSNNHTNIRDILVQEIEDDLVGPRGGPEEILSKGEYPTSIYLSGILFPKDTPPENEDDERTTSEVDSTEDELGADENVNPNLGTRPSSFGLTCHVIESTKSVNAEISYGTYFPEKIKNNQSIWKRNHFSTTYTIQIQEGRNSVDLGNSISLLYYVKKIKSNYALNIFLLNNREHATRGRTLPEECIFQPNIRLGSTNSSERIFSDAPSTESNELEETDEMMYYLIFRTKKQFAVGHSCSVEWDAPDNEGLVSQIKTTFVPKHEVPLIKPLPLDIKGLDMEILSKVTQFMDYKQLLVPITDEYEKWINNLINNKKELPEKYQKTAQNQIDECKIALQRIRDGIQVVSENPLAGEAFKFANTAMFLQRSYSEWAKQNRERKKVESDRPDKLEVKWRVFQIAFILLNIESIVNLKSNFRKYADLLWFATGGGKTEAYLGMIAFTLALRRLRYPNPQDDAFRYGVTVLMRYTLRLLTLQQFQRASTLICGCEYIRRNNIAKWGDEPFLIGLWVGTKTTPNSLQEASEALEKLRNGIKLTESDPVQLKSCPWCGEELNAYDYWVGGNKITQMRISCSRKKCFFNSRKDDEGLPVLLIDEDIYKRCPSLIIGTVDKFAQVSWKWQTASLFGKVDLYCQKDGFNTSNNPKPCGNHRDAKVARFGRELDPPELIIQDELHLISGPLGTLTGIYESVIDILCTRNGFQPKIIASTATTKNADEQIKSIFNRDIVKVFPPQGFSFGNSFFANEVSLQDEPGRLYIGVCATSKSGLTILARLSAVILRKVRFLKETKRFSDEKLDPYFTLVSYFNSNRELGGANRLYEDSVPGFMQRIHEHYESVPQSQDEKSSEEDAQPTATRKWVNEVLEKKELTGRMDSSEIPHVLKQLETTLKGGQSDPIDVLLCTNMISVGVDIDRLGVMIINGQPKNTSEYIQASGRIGRKYAGLIITSYNYLKPRDLSHYENFNYYHSTFHRNVEPVSLTPFASRARDRALFGIFVALIRLQDRRLSKDAANFDRNVGYVQQLISRISSQLLERVANIDPNEKNGTLEDLDNCVKYWDEFRQRNPNMDYKRRQYKDYKNNDNKFHLMKTSRDIAADGKIVPESLREAEQAANLWYVPIETKRSPSTQ